MSAKICLYKNIFHILCVRVFYRFHKRRSEKDLNSLQGLFVDDNSALSALMFSLKGHAQKIEQKH